MVTKPLVEWTARQIRDPLLRLRFLQAAGPRIFRPARPKRYKRAYLAVLTAILFPVVVFFVQPARGSRKINVALADGGGAGERGIAAAAAPARWNGHPEIWLVETREDAETYSNGLRVETRFAVSNRPRRFRAFTVARPE